MRSRKSELKANKNSYIEPLVIEGCDSCGAEVLYEMMEKMNYYLQIYNATEDGREPVEQVYIYRSTIIHRIVENQ